MAEPPEETEAKRMQLAFWVRADLAQRFRVLCERKKVFQREAAEAAIERYCEAEEKTEALP
jgi:hypothetical protein